MVHMEVAGGYVKQIWLVLVWAEGWQVKKKTFNIQNTAKV
jgi:hypothetical protein